MLYQINNGAVELGAELILKKINFEIRDREKIAIVGRNGCGKTTLLKLIAGEVDLYKRDSDEDIFIARSGNPEIGYLKQMAFDDLTMTVDDEIRKVFRPILAKKEKLEELVAAMNDPASMQDEELHARQIADYTRLQEEFEDLGGYYYDKEYQTMFAQFGFLPEDRFRPLGEFSGGQLTKLGFIRLLLSKPDILLLDEPTNHLDISTIEWLEDYLKNYKKAVVIVSHDRMFLDRIVDVVYEIEYKTAKRYPGNYTKFMETKRANYEKQKKDYELQQKEIARLEMIVEKYKNTPTKVAMTRSKLKAIEHMDKIEAPDRFDTHTFHANFKPHRETGKEVLRVTNLQIGYNHPLATVTMEQRRNQRIGIIGGNGIGKSTFLKTLMGIIPPLGGEFSFGYQVDVGYFDQQMAQYSSKKTVLDEFWDEYPTLDQTEVRSSLGAFLFTQEEVFKTVDMLSGGEKVRLALCRIFKTKPNFLILDEPTNHVDIIGKETLESMLKDFPGTVLFVSHDRYFIKQIADALLVFEGDQVRFLPYGYEEYLERKNGTYGAAIDRAPSPAGSAKQPSAAVLTAAAPAEPVIQKSKESYAFGKERSRLERRLQKAEEQVTTLENKLEDLKEEMNDPAIASRYSRLSELAAQIEEIEMLLLEAMEEWDDLEQKLKEYLA